MENTRWIKSQPFLLKLEVEYFGFGEFFVSKEGDLASQLGLLFI
jgi:hypothetical protein